MEIRKADETELKTIFSLSPQAIFEGTMGEIRPSDQKIERLVLPLLEKGSFYLVAAEEDELLGWILLGSTKDPFTDRLCGFIYELFVLEEYRGKGFSKKLMHAAIHYFKQEGYGDVRLSAWANNPAVKLYEKLGFKTKTVSMSLDIKNS